MAELERASAVPRRTIHFYVRSRVLPPPAGTAGGATYGEEHLLRLRLIPYLQNTHLRLEGIREALDGMTLGEMRTLERRAREGEAIDLVGDRRALGEWVAGTPEGKTARSFLRRQAAARERTWERFEIAEGVELSLRADVAASYRDLIVEVASKFRTPRR